jgi:hypothetical protein
MARQVIRVTRPLNEGQVAECYSQFPSLLNLRRPSEAAFRQSGSAPSGRSPIFRDADRLNEDQVRVFDDVLSHLLARVETTTARRFGLAWPRGRDTPDPNTSASQNSFVTVLIWIDPRAWGE